MRFTKIDEIPQKRTYHHLKDDLERFIQSGAKIVKIEFHQGEYKNATVASGCLRLAIKRHLFTGIKVIQRGDDVYLVNDNL